MWEEELANCRVSIGREEGYGLVCSRGGRRDTS
jgi:hypothetical protein